MSIYIAIPSMFDNQLPFTVEEAISQADSPEELSIHVVFMDVADSFVSSYPNFFEEKVKPLEKHPQVALKYYKMGEYVPSVGFGRKEALSMYNGQDHILQIDSHTKFEKGWDTILIKMYKEALEETKNEKTILTAYLPAYEHDDANIRGYFGKTQLAKFPFFLFKFRFDGGLPSWSDKNLVHGEPSREELYVPCVKFNAQFAFSNKHFYENSGLPETVIFWEEELIQTMNLLDAGFSLVFPNQAVPLAHLFHNNVNQDIRSNSYRVSGANPKGLPSHEYIKEIRDSYFAFIEAPENKAKVDRFYSYSRVHPVYGPYLEHYIPSDYNR